MDATLGSEGRSFSAVIKEAEEKLEMSRRTATRYLERLKDSGIVAQGGGLYWVKGANS